MKFKKAKIVSKYIKNGILIVGMWTILGPPFIYSLWQYHKNEEKRRSR